ncbi:hypothetical protein ACVIGB_002018 [Bradyrhizobium sp. USDA 4341]
MKDSEARGIVLKKMYDLRETKDRLELPDFADTGLEVDKVGRVLEQLAEKGLIQWNPRRSSMTSAVRYMVIMAKISAFGVDVVEGDAAPPMAITIDSSINVHASQGVQIGGHGNIQNVNLNLERLNNYVDSSNASAAEKDEAKSLLKQVWENPLVKGAIEWGAKYFGGG